MWWCLGAFASPSNGDFEAGLDGWNDVSFDPGQVSVVTEGDDFSLLGGDTTVLLFPGAPSALMLRGGPANPLQYASVQSDPFLITHDQLRVDAYNESPNTITQFNLIIDGLNQGLLVLDPLAESWMTATLDVSLSCGDFGAVRFVQTADIQRGFTLVDDVRGGSICALYLDADGDGECPQGVDDDGDGTCTQPGEGVAVGSGSFDCDDSNAQRFSTHAEIPDDGIDQDCDGADVTAGCFVDLDNDGFGTTSIVGPVGCAGPALAEVGGDCDDFDALAFPGQVEACDGRDTDCDGTGDGPPITAYLDGDGDGFGAAEVEVCGFNELAVAQGGDCADDDLNRYPGATESVADGVDQDCDGFELCYVDADMDGHGTTATVAGPLACSVPPDDCDDTDFTVHPLATEACDGRDNDCDEEVDEGLPQFPFYLDVDGDGYGSDQTMACNAPGPDWISASGDCDEGDATVYPGADELPVDGIDQDCDGGEACYTDSDGDGFGTPLVRDSPDLTCTAPGESNNDDDCNDVRANVYPGAQEEVGNDVDEDCDGIAVQFGDDTDQGRLVYRGGALCQQGSPVSFTRALSALLRR